MINNLETSSSCYSGLQVCGSVWMCPVCSAKISERRRVELSEGVAAWPGKVCLVTYTIRHKAADDLGRSVDGLLKARRRACSSGAWMKLKEKYGIAGSVRALEVTHGANGWHPHIHELLFVAADVDLAQLEIDLRRRWDKALAGTGMRDVNSHGVKVDQAYDLSVADYIAKFGHERTWGPEHEVAKAVSKAGRQESRTPVQLLSAYTFEGDAKAGALWGEYATVFKGKRQLVWSDGLRDLLDLGEDQTDEEVAAEQEEQGILIYTITPEEWEAVLANDARAEVLEIAAKGGGAAVEAYVKSLLPAPAARHVWMVDYPPLRNRDPAGRGMA